jgi:hypothetical protein
VISRGEGVNEDSVVVSRRGDERLHWESKFAQENPGVLGVMLTVVRVTLTVLLRC